MVWSILLLITACLFAEGEYIYKAKTDDLLLSQVKKNVPSESTVKILIDTDAGWDDIVALIYLLKNKNVEIVGISLTGCGEVNLYWGQVLVSFLLEQMGKSSIPLALGAQQPLEYNHQFPLAFRNELNTLYGLIGEINLQTPPPLSDKRRSDEFIKDMILEHKNLRILSIGGLTNIANMLINYPKTSLENVEKLYVMGGAILVDGNVADLNNAKPQWNQGKEYENNYLAEWNMFIDPVAAQTVLKSSLPIEMIPLDACNYVTIPSDYKQKIKGNDIGSKLIRQLFKRAFDSSGSLGTVYVYDPLAAVICADGLNSYQSNQTFVRIDASQSPLSSGNIFITKEETGHFIQYVQATSARAFFKEYSSVFEE